MAFGNQPVDAGLIPTSSVYSPNNGFETLQGEPGAFQDGSSNPSTAAIMSFLRPQIVQKAHNVTGSGGKTLTCAFTNNNIAQNSIVVCVGMGEVEAANITLTITDTNSNTYTQAVKASQSTTLESAIFYATGIAVGANTVTVTIAGSSSTNTAIGVQIYEAWGPIAFAGALDQTATGSNAGSTSVATGAVVAIVPNELAFVTISAAGGTITAGANWTLDSTSLSPTGGNLVSFGAESQSLSTIASVTPAATLSSSNAWAACCATFKSVIVPIEGTINLAQVGGAIIALGQTAMSASVPVTIASNQGAIGVQVVAVTVLNQASAAQTANGNSADLAVGALSKLAVDCNITAASGTTPTLQFFIDRKGADGIYYPIWQSITITAATQISTSIGAGMAYNQGFGSTIRLRWVIGGTAPSFTFSASVVGR